MKVNISNMKKLQDAISDLIGDSEYYELIESNKYLTAERCTEICELANEPLEEE